MSGIDEKQTLFDYVYQNLYGEIVSGRLGYGAKLPSMTRLCESYHVGIRTVKDVLSRLKEEGYIRTEERRAATVIYRRAELDSDDAARRLILSCKEDILDVYRTVTLIMPLVFGFSAQFLHREKQEEWKQLLSRARRKKGEARWQICSMILFELLEGAHNILFRELFVSLELYARIPLFQKHGRYLKWVEKSNQFQDLIWVMESILTGDRTEVVQRFRLMFQSVQNSLKNYLDELQQWFGPVSEERKEKYFWNARRGKNHYYTQITQDLIEKIYGDVYPKGSFLPNEADLASEYGVCVSTVRSALAILNRIGMCRTFNAKGTQVVRPEKDRLNRCLFSEAFRRDLLLYLSGIELMTIIIAPAALESFAQISSEAKDSVRQMIQESNEDPLEPLVLCVAEHLPLQSLKNILLEICKLLHWGYYFRFYSKNGVYDKRYEQKSRQALACLCNRDAEGFAKYLQESYEKILEEICTLLVSHGFSPAREFWRLGEFF